MIAQTIWRATKYLFLIVFSSIVGAYLGTGVGLAIGAITGEPSWAAHGRCAGWTLFVLVAVIGTQCGFVYFCNDTVIDGKKSRNQRTPPLAEEKPQRLEAEEIEGGVKAVLVTSTIGAFMGFILGGMVGGFLIAFYFFAALSPLGPGGWWPVLPLSYHSSGDEFSTKNPLILVPWLIVVGTFVILGVGLGLFGGVTYGQKRFQVFRSKRG